MKKNHSRYVVYGVISLACSISTVAAILVLWLKEANNAKTEPGIADFPLELLLWLYIFPIVHVTGFLSGLRSFWLQPKTNGIGLWSLAACPPLFLFDAFIWFRLMN